MRCCSSVLWAAIVAAATMDAAAAELTDAPVVLFIGNSYTQQNDLAGMVQVSVQARPGESLMARSSTMDGAQWSRYGACAPLSTSCPRRDGPIWCFRSRARCH
jgi:hypothetical protein